MDKCRTCVVFDLDDTIIKEKKFVISAYEFILKHFSIFPSDILFNNMVNRFQNNEDVLDWLIDILKTKYNIITDINYILNLYRFHNPDIKLESSIHNTINVLIENKVKLGLVSDGRSTTQRNKLKALNIEDKFDSIIISEEIGSTKPNLYNYKLIESSIPSKIYWYIGDNTSKDFQGPYKLGWNTICIKDNGENIHKQNLEVLKPETVIVNEFSDIIRFVLG